MSTMSAPMVVFHQCMDKEWLSWGRDSAKEMAARGFAVVRIKTTHYSELKVSKPESFARPLHNQVTEQMQACAVMMRDVTLPMIGYFHLQQETDLRKLPSSFEVELPPGDEPVIPYLDVLAITEASSLLPPSVGPAEFRKLYYNYPQGLVWAGFCSAARTYGSKLLLGRYADFSCLHGVLNLMKMYHVDQMYKCFQNSYFTVVSSKKEILMGVRDHISSCGTGPADAMNGLACILHK